MLTARDDGWIEVVGNLGKARKSWGAVISDTEPVGGRSESVRKTNSLGILVVKRPDMIGFCTRIALFQLSQCGFD